MILHVITWTILGLMLAVLVFFVKRALPNLIQHVLNDVGESIKTQFTAPAISKAMGILGNKSGEVRANNALRTKVSTKVMDGLPVIKKALEYFDISPVEVFELMRDPIFGPIIQGFMNKGAAGVQDFAGKLLGGPGQPGQNLNANKNNGSLSSA